MTDDRELKLQAIRDKIKDYAKAQAERDYLDEFKKSQLAILMKKYQTEYPTAAAQEREARADPEYKKLLEGLREAVENAERLRWELKLEEWQLEVWRTKQANQRAERKNYGA